MQLDLVSSWIRVCDFLQEMVKGLLKWFTLKKPRMGYLPWSRPTPLKAGPVFPIQELQLF